MKRITAVTLSLLLSSVLLANETQVFTAKTMDVKIDKKSKVEKIFSGKYEDFNKEFPKIMENKMADIAKTTAAATGLFVVGMMAKTGANMSNFKADGGLVGLGIGLAIGAIVATKEYICRDNEYEYVSMVTNFSGERTILQTHIVANDPLSPEELETIGHTNQDKFIETKGSL